MSKKYLYHGTDLKSAEDIISNGIDLNKGRGNIDFGKGFYMTEDKTQAIRWAANLSNKSAVLKFYIDKAKWNSLNKLNLNNDFDHWSNIVYSNRVIETSTLNYDVIYGPMADTGINRLVAMAKNQIISKEDFKNRINSRAFGNQVALKSKATVNSIMFIDKEVLK